MQTERLIDATSEYVMLPILKRFAVPEADRIYWISFYIHGTMAIVKEWLGRNCTDSVDDIMRVMIECIRPGTEVKRYED